MLTHDKPIEDQVADHETRNVFLVQRLRGMGVDPAVPRLIDLHFFMPSPSVARELAVALQIRGVKEVLVGQPRPPDGTTSLTISVLESVATIITRPYIEFLVRAAVQLHGVHDGWGTSVERNQPTAP
ncbi:MAG: ribonuclease E inhibitor RraB [Thermoanaerobaculia bacterium]